MLYIEERDDVTPKCPYCESGLSKLWAQKIRAFFGKRYVYFCPYCQKVLGISHRKGLWTQ